MTTRTCCHPSFLLLVLAAACTVSLAAPALAGDGRIEISQTVAEEGGVNGDLVADPAGFPVEITEAGSYVLTSNLTVPGTDTHGIEIKAGIVDLDFNGFGVIGSSTAGTGTGVVARGALAGFVILRNGFIANMPGLGASLNVAKVTGMTIAANLQGGVTFFEDGAIVDSQIFNNTPYGVASVIDFGGDPDTRVHVERTISRNLTSFDFKTEGFALTPGRFQFGPGNVCDDDARCNPDGRRAFYRTPLSWDAADALTVCEDGFHMASRWELLDVSNLVFDQARSQSSGSDDLGGGPEADAPAWIRTGGSPDTTNDAGRGNCSSYTSDSVSHWGTLGELDIDDATNAAVSASPWRLTTEICSVSRRVWCVQD